MLVFRSRTILTGRCNLLAAMAQAAAGKPGRVILPPYAPPRRRTWKNHEMVFNLINLISESSKPSDTYLHVQAVVRDSQRFSYNLLGLGNPLRGCVDLELTVFDGSDEATLSLHVKVILRADLELPLDDLDRLRKRCLCKETGFRPFCRWLLYLETARTYTI